MKVLFFVHRFWPSVGGVEKYVRHLATAVRTAGHDVTVVAGDTRGGLREIETHEGVSIYRFPASRSTLRCRMWMWRHRRLFQDADVVQVSNTHMLEYLWRMLGPWLDRRKIFLTRHGFGGTYPIPEAQRRRAKKSLGLAAGFIHDGEFIAHWLGVPADETPRQGIFPKAIDLPDIPEPPPTSAVYVGRLEPDTAIQIYVDGIRELVVKHRRPITFHVIGEGSLLCDLRARAADEHLPIEFHGSVPDAQNRISDYCFAFVDGRMAIQEAMARKRVVIAAYDNPLRRDYVSGESFSPFLVPVANAGQLAVEVMQLIDNIAVRGALTDRAFAYAKTLSWEATAQVFVALWRNRLATPLPLLALWDRISIFCGYSPNRNARTPQYPLGNAGQPMLPFGKPFST